MQQLSLFSFDTVKTPPTPLLRTHLSEAVENNSVLTSQPPKYKSSSDPLLLTIWLQLARSWFPGRDDLRDYQLKWSPRRQKQTLASVSLERARVFVARELNYSQLHRWLEPLLYHEMCHAYLRSEYHDRRFYDVERRHPGIKDFDSWIDEGGWATAIRSDRAKRAHAERKKHKLVSA